MSSLLALFLLFCFGVLLLSIVFSKQEFPGKRSLMFAFALPVSFGVVSLMMFLSYLIVNQNGYSLCLSLMGLLSLCLLITHPPDVMACRSGMTEIRTKASSTKKQLSELKPMLLMQIICGFVLVYCIAHFWQYFWTEAAKNPFGGWDGRYFWNLKARFYFRVPHEWRQMFSHYLGDWSHPDYPLMLPGIVAWGWLFRGYEQLTWPLTVGLTYTLSLFILVFWYLHKNTNAMTACLGAAFMTSVYMFYFWSTTQYADIPLALYFTAASLFLITALRSNVVNLFFLSGLSAGFAVWTKDEGYFFLIFITLLLVLTVVKKPDLPTQQKKSILVLFSYGALIPVICSLFIKLVLSETGGQYAGSGRGISDFMQLLFGDPNKTKFIGLAFGLFAINLKQWNGLWILFAVVSLLGGKRAFQNYRWINFILVFMILGGYFFIMHITPHDLRFQISSALMRIMSHAAPLAVIFTFEAIGLKINAMARDRD